MVFRCMNSNEVRRNDELLVLCKENMPNHNKQHNKDLSKFPEMTKSALPAVNLAFGIKQLVIQRAQLK